MDLEWCKSHLVFSHFVPDLPACDCTDRQMEGGQRKGLHMRKEGWRTGHGNRQFCPGNVQMHRLAYTTVPRNPAHKRSISSIYDCSIFAVRDPFVCVWLWSLGISDRQTLSNGPMWETSSLLVGQRGIPSLRRDLLYLSAVGPLWCIENYFQNKSKQVFY